VHQLMFLSIIIAYDLQTEVGTIYEVEYIHYKKKVMLSVSILNREITETLPKCVENLSQHHIGTKRGNQTQHTTSGIRSLEKKNMFHLKMSHVHLKSNQIHQIRTPAKKPMNYWKKNIQSPKFFKFL